MFVYRLGTSKTRAGTTNREKSPSQRIYQISYVHVREAVRSFYIDHGSLVHKPDTSRSPSVTVILESPSRSPSVTLISDSPSRSPSVTLISDVTAHYRRRAPTTELNIENTDGCWHWSIREVKFHPIESSRRSHVHVREAVG